MLTSKTFIKKTKTGKILKIVREHYLRDDITCGVESCTECDGPSSLESVSDSLSEMCPREHLLCPDTNVILHQVRTRLLSFMSHSIQFLGTSYRRVYHNFYFIPLLTVVIMIVL